MAVAGISKHRDTCARCGKQYMRAPGSAPYCFACTRHMESHVTVACAQCGKQFSIGRKRHEAGRGKFCSAACSNLARITRIDIECEYCGRTVERARPGQRFCSTRCMNLHVKEEAATVRCYVCGAACERSSSGRSYCSSQCAVEAGALVQPEDPYEWDMAFIGFDGSAIPATCAQALPVW